MAKVTEQEKDIAELFLRQWHFTKVERDFIFLIIVKNEITEKEKQRFGILIRQHKYLLN